MQLIRLAENKAQLQAVVFVVLKLSGSIRGGKFCVGK